MIPELSGEFPVRLLCGTMEIQGSSFCHWEKRLSDPAPKTKAPADSIILFRKYHIKYPSHGYRWLNAKIKPDTGLNVSDHMHISAADWRGSKADQSITGTKSPVNHVKYIRI